MNWKRSGKNVLELNEDFSIIIQSPQRMKQLTATKSRSILPLEVRGNTKLRSYFNVSVFVNI